MVFRRPAPDGPVPGGPVPGGPAPGDTAVDGPPAASLPAGRTPARSTAVGAAARVVVAAALLAVVVGLPLGSRSLAYDAATAAAYALVGLSMNLLVGYTGQISLGQQGFIGLGALAAANVAASGTTPAQPVRFGFSLLVAALVGAGAATVLGVASLRITGLYLGLTTLVFGTTVSASVLGIPALNGADAGVKAVPPSLVGTPGAFYLLCLALVLAAVALDRRVTESKIGRALLALRESELVAQAFGIDVVGYKLLAFALTGALAGLAGALLAFGSGEFSQKNFTDVTGFDLALTFVVVAVVGGLGSRLGAVAAAVFFAFLPPLLSAAFTGVGLGNFYVDHKNYLPGLVQAVLLLYTVIANPGGLGQLLDPLAGWLAGRTAASGAARVATEGMVGDVRA